jgi:hypothetical protein
MADAETTPRGARREPMTTTLRIEHGVADYARWKQMFDSDPLNRKGSGVRGYRVLRMSDEPDKVAIDLDFEDAGAARVMAARLSELWNGPASAIMHGATLRIWDVTEVKAL